MTVVYFMTYFGGHNMWKFELPIIHVPSGRLFELIMHGQLRESVYSTQLLLCVLFGFDTNSGDL